MDYIPPSLCNLWDTRYLCGKYDVAHALFDCGDRDFLSTFYYTTVRKRRPPILLASHTSHMYIQAMQTLALFALKLDRLPAVIGAVAFFIL